MLKARPGKYCPIGRGKYTGSNCPCKLMCAIRLYDQTRDQGKQLHYIGYVILNTEDPNISDNGVSPLMTVIMEDKWGFGNIVDSLLEHPALDINAITPEGYTALMWASKTDKILTVKKLLTDNRMDLSKHNQGERSLSLAQSEQVKNMIKNAMPKSNF